MAATSSAAAIVVCFVCCARPFAGDDPADIRTVEDGVADAIAASVEGGGEAAVVGGRNGARRRRSRCRRLRDLRDLRGLRDLRLRLRLRRLPARRLR